MQQSIKIFCFGITLYMFRMVFPSFIRSSRLYTQLLNRYCHLLTSKQTAVSVSQMSVALCTVFNPWWWTERPSETCRVSFQNKINLIQRFHLVPTSKQTAVSVSQMSVALCTVFNSWWWTERPSETCRVSFQNKINLIQRFHLVPTSKQTAVSVWQMPVAVCTI